MVRRRRWVGVGGRRGEGGEEEGGGEGGEGVVDMGKRGCL